MNKAAASLKVIGPCLALAGTALFIVSRISPSDYSETTGWLLLAGWFFGGLMLAWLEPQPLLVYLGAVALAAPVISYSMVGHGLLEMGGWLHALMAGACVMPFYLLFQRIRERRVGFNRGRGIGG